MASAARTFLAACAASGPADWEGRGAELRALGPREWQSVADYAAQHRLAGLVARSLGWIEEATGFQAPVRERLEATRRVQLVRHLASKAAARRIAQALDASAIPFIAFKGMVLAEEVYGDLSLRDFCDFDAMVPKERLDEAFARATELGYRLTHLGHVREHVRAGAHAAGMEHPDGSAFDLHWSLAPGLDAGKAAIVWRNCEPAGPNARFPGLRLSAALMLLHLAKHFHVNQYCAFRSLVDFHVVCRELAGAIDPQALEALARQLDLSAELEIVAALRQRTLLFETARPDAAAPRSLKARIALRCIPEGLMLDSPRRSRIGNWLRFLVASGSFAAAAGSIREILLPGELALVRFFNRPFRGDMYPRYYWRQLRKVVTLARK
jgi:hypothetical protein